MTAQTARRLAIAGFALQVPFWCGLFVGAGILMKGFDAMASDLSVAEASTAATGTAAAALSAVVRVAQFALLGAIFITIALKEGVKDRWVFKLGLVSSVAWLFYFPNGTLVGLMGITYFLVKRKSFRAPNLQG